MSRWSGVPAETYYKAQQIIENRDRFGNDPGNRPQGQCNSHPRPDREETLFLHVLRATENADLGLGLAYKLQLHAGPYVDVFARDMAEDDTGNENLREELMTVMALVSNSVQLE